MLHLVLVEVLQLDGEKSQSALIAIEGIWVFAGYWQEGVSDVELII